MFLDINYKTTPSDLIYEIMKDLLFTHEPCNCYIENDEIVEELYEDTPCFVSDDKVVIKKFKLLKKLYDLYK